jgi:hypothetical protein
MHPINMQELHEARYRDLLKEAETWRMVHQSDAARPAKPNLVKRTVAGVRTFLIDAGKRLTERYALPDEHSV